MPGRRRPSQSLTRRSAGAALLFVPIAVIGHLIWLAYWRRAPRHARARRRRPRTTLAMRVAPLVFVPVALIGHGIWLARRRRPAVVVPAAADSRPREARVGRRTPRATLASVVAVLSLAAVVSTTRAIQSDQATTAQISATAGTVQAPTGLTLQNRATDTRVSWTAPAAGITPESYDVFRATAPRAYGGSADANPSASPWDDSTTVECETYYYKVRSRHTHLVSGFTGEASIVADHTAPTLVNSAIVATSGADPTAGLVKPSGEFYAYAKINDACTADGALTVTFDLSAIGGPSSAAATDGSYTPVGGGPTYDFRAGPFTADSGLANGATPGWTITRDDHNGNSPTSAGAAVTVDGAGPTVGGAEMVSASTNFYDVAFGRGEIPSDGAAAGSGSYIYANVSDAGGVQAVTADLDLSAPNRIKAGANALALAAGTYATYAGGSSWGWRSAATVVDTGMADGNRDFRLTATDRVGNVSAADQAVEVDDTPIDAAATTCTNGGDANGELGDPDVTDLNFGDTVYPDSIKSGWDGTVQTATTTLRDNGANDYFDFNTDFGLQMLQGTASNQSFDLGLDAVGVNTAYANSTVALQDRTTVRVSYKTGSVAGVGGGTATIYVGTGPTDAAGNPVAAGFAETCALNPW